MLKESTRIYRDLGDLASIAMNLCRFALALAVEGRAATAAQALASSEALYEEIGTSVDAWIVEMNDSTLARIRAQLDQAAFAEAWEQGRRLSLDAAVTLALDSLD